MRTGSLVNLVTTDGKQADPKVGDGATICGWTDRHAATIVEVSKSGKAVAVQYDHAKRTDANGMSESQTYEYSANPEGRKEVYTLRKNGAWVKQGEPLKDGGRISIGARNSYYDFSF